MSEADQVDRIRKARRRCCLAALLTVLGVLAWLPVEWLTEHQRRDPLVFKAALTVLMPSAPLLVLLGGAVAAINLRRLKTYAAEFDLCFVLGCASLLLVLTLAACVAWLVVSGVYYIVDQVINGPAPRWN